jgi:hypothetical protein
MSSSVTPNEPEWTSEGDVESANAKKRRRESRAGKRKKGSGGRMILERWTQAILPPGSDDNPNTPGI